MLSIAVALSAEGVRMDHVVELRHREVVVADQGVFHRVALGLLDVPTSSARGPSTGSTLSPMILQLRFSNSGRSPAM